MDWRLVLGFLCLAAALCGCSPRVTDRGYPYRPGWTQSDKAEALSRLVLDR